ncbi:hypothetical protein GCM10025789_19880 [Tessaracoccus lubricantis]|uniref:Cytochrome b5 heme-binding domain-containing protein n=1 Tax=Tessaracoccus lubricantis TaxID=545543 RepID=A0ABP9FGX9_9ACTN
MLEDILGLPAHPLFVHLPVVLLPLSALGIFALTLKPAWRPRFAIVVLGVLALGALGAVGAWATGDDLAAKVGLPVQHSELGMWTTLAAVVLLVVGGIWLWRVRRADPASERGVFGWVVSALALVVLVLITLTGHSGATAAWSGVEGATSVVERQTATPEPTAPEPTEPSTGSTDASPTPTAGGVTSEATTPTPAGYTMADVEAHDTPEDCWVAINGNVYDVTEWIPQHPGGPDRIIALCGTDATAQFTGQHAQTDVAKATLETFLLGPLG